MCQERNQDHSYFWVILGGAQGYLAVFRGVSAKLSHTKDDSSPEPYPLCSEQLPYIVEEASRYIRFILFSLSSDIFKTNI